MKLDDAIKVHVAYVKAKQEQLGIMINESEAETTKWNNALTRLSNLIRYLENFKRLKTFLGWGAALSIGSYFIIKWGFLGKFPHLLLVQFLLHLIF